MGHRAIQVKTASRSYRVLVGSGLLGSLGEHAGGWKRAVILADAGVADLDGVESSLHAAGVRVMRPPAITPSEADKSIRTVERMLEAMCAARLERGDVVIAVGGGVIGDMAGFAAATYRRGIEWVNCPTTLLSMVDASVGGKTGVNLSVGGVLKKNMVGAFWQPSLVVADVQALATLPDRHFRSGLAECIKHGMLAAEFGDGALGAWTGSNLWRVVGREQAALVELVARNVAVKAAVVREDEREERDGGRALLNLGHTFGHVLETLPGIEPMHHGEAVGLGLIAASAAAVGLGTCRAETVERTRGAVAAAGLPVMVRGLPAGDRLVELMLDDKKVTGGRLRIVVPSGDGRCRVVTDPAVGAVEAGWDSIRAG